MDEMSIREQLDLIDKRYTGYVYFGTGIDSDNLPLAKEALVLILVALNDRWIPTVYFSTAGVQVEQKATLVQGCLHNMTYNAGVKVVSLTFDGAATNFAMSRQLGASFEVHGLQPWFPHRADNSSKVL